MRLGMYPLVAALVPSIAVAQSFTCGIGDRPACLEYGDMVCSTFGKCVSADAACLGSY